MASVNTPSVESSIIELKDVKNQKISQRILARLFNITHWYAKTDFSGH